LKKKFYIWCCDKTTDSGEGILANKFIKDVKNYNKEFNFEIKAPNKKNINFLRKFFGNIIDRLIFPCLGIIYLWSIYIFKKNKILCYVNYLPLWNFLIFLFIPPGTILGPITGGSKFLKKPILNYIIRNYIFNIFYKISIFILNIKKKKLLFSTGLLKDKINKKRENYFNYVLKDFKFNNKNLKKEYDLIFYLRNHKNKNTNLQIKLAKELCYKFKIVTCGEKINNKKIKNFGKVKRNKLDIILQKTKYSFISSENLYSLFSIDCLKNGIYIFYNNQEYPKKQILRNMIPLNYNNYKNLAYKLNTKLNKRYIKPKKITLKTNNNYSNYFTI